MERPLRPLKWVFSSASLALPTLVQRPNIGLLFDGISHDFSGLGAVFKSQGISSRKVSLCIFQARVEEWMVAGGTCGPLDIVHLLGIDLLCRATCVRALNLEDA